MQDLFLPCKQWPCVHLKLGGIDTRTEAAKYINQAVASWISPVRILLVPHLHWSQNIQYGHPETMGARGGNVLNSVCSRFKLGRELK